jgi:hypothetical protein
MRRFVALAVVVAGLVAPINLAHSSAATDPMPPAQPAAPADRANNAYQATPTDPAPTTTVAPNPCDSIPGNSGSGRRVVYRRGSLPMRVWIVDENETLLRCYKVSGHKLMQWPAFGTYAVYSRSAYTCNIEHTWVCMRWMVRFAHAPDGDNIGFHEIPRDNGVPIESVGQLGQNMSSGCVRQSTEDAQYMWAWAYIGTKVVVIP